MDRKELYKLQVEALNGTNFHGTAFVPSNFKCWHCNRDMLEHEKTLEEAKRGELLTSCPFCRHSYCD